MPIYEFRCKGCECQFETLVMGSSPDVCCPECACREVERLMSACSYKSGTTYVSSKGSGCGSCSATSCATCH